MRKVIIFVLLLLFLGVVVILGAGISKKNVEKDVLQTGISRVEDVEKIPDVPVTLTIPQINVETTIESVGMDSQGRMDVPKNADNVAWYNLGNKPGSKGNAVIAGHFDKETGEPAVFFDIDKLSIGDTLTTTDVKGEKYNFSIVRIERYPYNDFPLQEVFGSSQDRFLNLITCQGEWDKETKNYSHRTVIYSKLID
jgi:sortase (surface protein transpeptidase)